MFLIKPAKSNELKRLHEGITDSNVLLAPDLPRAVIKDLNFYSIDSYGKMTGGIQAIRVNWGILEIDLLFVFSEFRKQGIGSRLLKHVEDLARQNGCVLAKLDTFDFQAKDFYLKHGYEIFGVLNDCPKGHCRYYMSKKLNE